MFAEGEREREGGEMRVCFCTVTVGRRGGSERSLHRVQTFTEKRDSLKRRKKEIEEEDAKSCIPEYLVSRPEI